MLPIAYIAQIYNQYYQTKKCSTSTIKEFIQFGTTTHIMQTSKPTMLIFLKKVYEVLMHILHHISRLSDSMPFLMEYSTTIQI